MFYSRCRFRCPRIKPQGFALLEILISVMILTVGVVAIIQTLGTASYCLQENQHYQQAMNLSENEMFDLLRQRPLESNKNPSTISPQSFTFQWETTDFFDAPENKDALNSLLRKASLHVRWGSTEKQREVRIVTGMLQTEQ